MARPPTSSARVRPGSGSPQCTVTDAVVADPSVQPWRWAVTFTVIFWPLSAFTRTWVDLVAPVMALPLRFQE